MTEREEREKVIEVLQYEKKTALHDRWAFDYAINSIKTDLKYDLLYEETSGQADKQADKPTTKNDLALIHTYGLDEEIRCTMCTNSMKSDRGCDGSCVVNNAMYKNVMDAIEKRIQPTTKDYLGVDYLGVDCIDRQATLGAIIKRLGIRNESYLLPAERTIYQQIKDMPSVTPQPRKGHWIGHREHCENLGVMPSGLGAYEWCSNCDCGIDVREWHRNHYNYCPNCGAKMESEDNK